MDNSKTEAAARNDEDVDADEDEGKASDWFPPVPVFYKGYGENGVKHELAVSLDPPVPPDGPYYCFGTTWKPDEKDKTLEEEGRAQLFEYPADGSPLDYAKEVSKICRLAVKRYLEFLEGLQNMDETPPGASREKAESFESVFINLLYLVNQLRPAQGRQLLINMLKRQTQSRRESAKKLGELIDQGEALIKEALEKASQPPPSCDSKVVVEAAATQQQKGPVDMDISAEDQPHAINVFDQFLSLKGK